MVKNRIERFYVLFTSHVCLSLWRYICVHTYGEARGQPQLSFLGCHLTWFLRQPLSLACSLATRHDLMTCWCMDPGFLGLPGPGTTNLYHHSTTSRFWVFFFNLLLMWIMHNQTSCLQGKCFVNWVTSPVWDLTLKNYTSSWKKYEDLLSISPQWWQVAGTGFPLLNPS